MLAATGPEREEAVAAARERGVPVRPMRTGSVFQVGGSLLRVLWPPDPGLPSEDPNLNATVIVASYGELDVFLPADAESDVTARLPLRAVEILKVAHHGSADPGLDEELRVLRPQDRRDLRRKEQRLRPSARRTRSPRSRRFPASPSTALIETVASSSSPTASASAFGREARGCRWRRSAT